MTFGEPISTLSAEGEWILRFEGFDAARERAVEGLLGIANGYAGTRGALEELVPASQPLTLLAGVFDPIRPQPCPPDDPADSPAPVVGPNWTMLRVEVDGEPLSLASGAVLEHQRALDLQHGWLVRRWRQRLASGRVVRLTTLRFASLADRHVFVQRAWLALDDGSLVRVAAALDARAPEGRLEHARAGRPAPALPADLLVRAPRSGIAIAAAQRCRVVRADGAAVETTRDVQRHDGCFIESWSWRGEPKQTYVFDRVVALFTSRDVEQPAARAAEHLARVAERGVEALLEAHRHRWGERWQACDIEIEGDADAERAVRLAAYHLISNANPHDERASIGARGLTADAYRAHVLWDTDTYMLPFFTFTWPAAARAMLTYRFDGLDAARERAARLGFRGALFAWESAVTGHEATPKLERDPDGNPIPIHTGERAHHISADIAYAVWHYWQASADDEFFATRGAEILVETARFWASRASAEADGCFHIRGVMGPDEYHQCVDDSAYTNAMARWNLHAASLALEWLRREAPDRLRALAAGLDLGEHEVATWRSVADAIASPTIDAHGVMEQFAGYFTLRDINVPTTKRHAFSLQAALGLDAVGRTQGIKQADVVLLCYLLADAFDAASIAANFDYYAPRCDHASSLSPSIHALVAARLGRSDTAVQYFRKAAAIDFGEPSEAGEGIHMANCGGLWQALVFGFAGLRWQEDRIAFEPCLPQGWRALRFPLLWRGRQLRVEVTPDGWRTDG